MPKWLKGKNKKLIIKLYKPQKILRVFFQTTLLPNNKKRKDIKIIKKYFRGKALKYEHWVTIGRIPVLSFASTNSLPLSDYGSWRQCYSPHPHHHQMLWWLPMMVYEVEGSGSHSEEWVVHHVGVSRAQHHHPVGASQHHCCWPSLSPTVGCISLLAIS